MVTPAQGKAPASRRLLPLLPALACFCSTPAAPSARCAHVAPLDEVDDVLGDVGREVGDALQVFGDEDELHGAVDGREVRRRM